MSTLGTIIKYLFLVILTALLAGQLAALVVMQSASSVALDPSFYAKELDSSGAYALVYNQLNTTIAEKGGPRAAALLALSGIQLTDVVTQDWMKRQANNLIQHGLAYVKRQENQTQLVVDLTEPKAKLYAAAEAKIQQLPPSLQNATQNLLASYQLQFNQQVPDQLDMAQQPGAMDLLNSGRNADSLFQSAMLGLIIFASVLAILIVALTRKSIQSIARWMGLSLLAGGALAWIVLAAIQQQAIDFVKASASTPKGAVLLKIVTDGATAVQQAAFPWMAALIIGGIIGIAASFLIKLPIGPKIKEAPDKEKVQKETKTQ